MSHKAPLFLLILVLLSGSAAAFTFGPITNFASTRSGQVAWAANVSIEAESLIVRANDIRLDAQRIDIEPDGLQKIRVYITRYSNDYRTFRVVMVEGARTGLNVTYTNPGYDLKVYQASVNTHTCGISVSICSWVFSNQTDFNFSVLTPAGVAQYTGEGLPAPAEAGGGGGAPAPVSAPNPRAVDPIGELPKLPDLFPRFSTWRWAFLILGGVLLFNGILRTRAFLPVFLRIPFRPDLLLFAGAVTLTLVYLTPIPEPGSATP